MMKEQKNALIKKNSNFFVFCAENRNGILFFSFIFVIFFIYLYKIQSNIIDDFLIEVERIDCYKEQVLDVLKPRDFPITKDSSIKNDSLLQSSLLFKAISDYRLRSFYKKIKFQNDNDKDFLSFYQKTLETYFSHPKIAKLRQEYKVLLFYCIVFSFFQRQYGYIDSLERRLLFYIFSPWAEKVTGFKINQELLALSLPPTEQFCNALISSHNDKIQVNKEEGKIEAAELFYFKKELLEILSFATPEMFDKIEDQIKWRMLNKQYFDIIQRIKESLKEETGKNRKSLEEITEKVVETIKTSNN